METKTMDTYAHKFAAKISAETLQAEPPTAANLSDDGLRDLFANCAKPPTPDNYPAIRAAFLFEFVGVTVETVTNHYLIALAWSSHVDDPSGETDAYGEYVEQVPADSLDYDWEPGTHDKVNDLLTPWLTKHADLVAQYLATGNNSADLGHNICLTSGHHGTGFWDRGLGELGDKLTEASQELPESGSSLEIWADHDTQTLKLHF